ncbi:MAG TPA: DUF1707 domain-containing protein [Streptosporangiaceae bacterium]
MDDRIRVSDADREQVTARLRDHYAEGRLTESELDERVSAALNAKTFGDLRGLMTDLPGPAPIPPQQAPQPPRPQWGGPPWMVYRRRPRILPVALLVLLAVLLFHGGGWVLAGFFQFLLLFWLFTVVAGLLFGLFRRRTHRRW